MTGVGVAQDRRLRDRMEDRVVTGVVPGGALVGVLDGHGGAVVADRAAAVVAPAVRQALEAGLDAEALWRQVFAGLDVAADDCGSTATLLLVGTADVSVAWVGDSRAILVTGTAWHVLTPDHRLDRADERARVLAAGAVIHGPYAVDPTTERGLMMTRSLGDRALRRIGIVPEPEIRAVRRHPDDVACVVATDGLWDVVSNDEVARICRAATAVAAAARLVALVAERGGADNVAVVVIPLGGAS